MARAGTDLACRCGQVRLHLAGDLPGQASRVQCYCKSCRAFLRHLNAMDLSDARGGTDLLHVRPDLLSLRAGADRLACLRLGPKGPLRWYAACCDTPLCVTGASARMPVAGLVWRALSPDAAADAAAGPATTTVFSEFALPGSGPVAGPAPRDAGMGRLVIGLVLRSLSWLMAGGGSPFFAEGRPLATPQILDKTQREAARRD